MKRIIIFLILFFIFFLIGSGIFLYRGIYLPKDKNLQTEKIFTIEKGQGIGKISSNLRNEGIIKYPIAFQIYVISKGIYSDLQTGDYLLSPSMNVPQISQKISKGEVATKKITIIEGWNLRDIAVYCEDEGLFNNQEFFAFVGFPLSGYVNPKDFYHEFSFLDDKPANLTMEGYLFPDTYELPQNVTLEQFIQKMLANFDEKLTPDLRTEISRQKKSIFEIITMASLLEREVKTIEDKKLVSGILWKRLAEGMPLQVDATVTYITSRKAANISIEETKIDSPYNTYKYKGLPLGPICNPGLESIKAAIYPESSGYWYYLSTPEGETIFSKTFSEHSAAAKKYLK